MNTIDEHNQSAVFLAAAFGAPEILEKLARAGADIERATKTRTPLQIATREHKLACVEALVRVGANVNTVDDS